MLQTECTAAVFPSFLHPEQNCLKRHASHSLSVLDINTAVGQSQESERVR
jgi:hypothetical protein